MLQVTNKAYKIRHFSCLTKTTTIEATRYHYPSRQHTRRLRAYFYTKFLPKGSKISQAIEKMAQV